MIRRVASRPSTPGIRMSISTTSGRCRATTSTASRPSGRLGDDLDVVLGVEQRPEPGAQQCLVVDQHDADHRSSRASDGRTAARRAPACRPHRPRTDLAACRRVPPRARACRRCRCRPVACLRRARDRRPRRSRRAHRHRTRGRCRRCSHPEWRTTLVIASCTIRSAASSTADGSGRTSPLLGLAHLSARRGRCARRGRRGRRACRWAVRGALSSASRRTPTSERSSTSASLLASLIAVERGLRLLGLAVDDVQGDPAWTLISEMWCATTSCSSRAICSRSSFA